MNLGDMLALTIRVLFEKKTSNGPNGPIYPSHRVAQVLFNTGP